ncbi:ABC-type metal ion transport system, periplasmic component/surface antigen [Clostridium aceticum]|uniref:Lipoprotein n=1 Tax=Clostridium aceticum TaxID=84022 RepID=A0A0D8IFB7_9CLOT|nr:MetQ/NlpA family ABC transporter substrate-binding protein [Clostridium aceticum]AKL93896.1 ABC-type metal ion transport system, periplasmic component/surface antigen [Clostridium aceticum]KJF28712.1 methionine ABC transporter substrate-binding protein [Clostridium aceticum]
MKKKSILFIVGLLVITLLAGCTQGTPAAEVETTDVEGDVTVLTVGATPVPHTEILDFIKPILLEEGIQLDIKEFTDYVTPNLALADGEIDANFFQHVPYMETFAANNNVQLSAVAKVHVEPLGLYSRKLNALEDLEDGATISIPNDPTNGGRALLLLQYYGLIELAEDAELTATEKDIASNPKNLKFIALEAPQLPRSLDDVAASVINTNYALEAGFNPVRDSLIIEDANSPYANVLTVRPEDENKETILILIDVLNSPEVREFLETKYEGAVVPAF